MISRLLLACATVVCALPAAAQDRTTINSLVAHHARTHGVPEALVHRVIRRESSYNPRALSKGNFGLMQIRYATARGMGYRGSPSGLLDANTNLTYAVPYLANAYKVAGGNADRAVALYAGGYYYEAKRKGLLQALGTAVADPVSTGSIAATGVALRSPTFTSANAQ
jgi:soluble lytic murein transglycosylase-like protein